MKSPIILILLVLFFIFCSGCTNQLSSNNRALTSVQTPSPASTTIATKISEFKDDEFGISFKYPDPYKTTKISNKISIQGVEPRMNNWINIYVYNIPQTLDQATEKFENSIKTSDDKDLRESKISTINSSIGGLNAKSVVIHLPNGDDMSYYIIVHDNKTYEIYYHVLSENIKSIINSIQFI